MQQTNKYKLNKPELDDPVAIAPLNENMDKLEAALIAEAKSRADADAAEANARTAAIQAEASARVSAVNAEISARTAAVNAEASARANADTTETNARIAADKAEANTRANADNALSQRVTVLEGKHIVLMRYIGDGAEGRVLRPGFTPTGIVYLDPYSRVTGFAVQGEDTQRGLRPAIVDGGVLVPNAELQHFYNQSGVTYYILMLN